MKTLKKHYLGFIAIGIALLIAFNWSGFIALTTQFKALALTLAFYFVFAMWVYFDRWLDKSLTKAYQEGFENASLDREHYGEKKYMDGWIDCKRSIKR